ncbi:MAG: N-acetylmuramoyl-L-alanine amidase [Phycisphaerae bacterium]|nr:N-acetylmuramoyl-L-alanine amidase [Phycisphaerae bacterium]
MATKRKNTAHFVSKGTAAAVLPYFLGALLGGVAVWLLMSGGERMAQAPPVSPDALAPPADFVWSEHPEPDFPIPPHARFLKDVKIVLDPGHIGQRDPGHGWKRGPTGLREAEVNLRVAQYLREFLNAAGADVVLTREADECLDLPDKEDLRQRAEAANREGADLFLSIHHNAADDPSANYTTLYYHASPDHSPASLCAARYLLTGLDSALRLDRQVGCALRSDYLHYPGEGFAVLRHARVPAVLSEASFHSNPPEEARLRDPVYNRREAYGLFLGLARWAQAGLPRVALVRPRQGKIRAGTEVLISLDDGLSARGGGGAENLRIQADSVVVRFDGTPVPHTLDRNRRQVRATVPQSLRGRCTLSVDFANVFGQHVLHPRIGLEVSGR